MPRVSTFLAAAEKAAGCLGLSRWSSPRRPAGKNDLDKARWRLEWEKQGRLGKHAKKPPSGGFFPCGAGLERPPLPGKEEEQTKKQKNKNPSRCLVSSIRPAATAQSAVRPLPAGRTSQCVGALIDCDWLSGERGASFNPLYLPHRSRFSGWPARQPALPLLSRKLDRNGRKRLASVLL